jgi:hypothetical protein
MEQKALVGQGFLIIVASRSHPVRHAILGGTPLDEWSAQRRDLYLPISNIHKRQTSTLPVGFETAIPGRERPQTQALDRAAILKQWHTCWNISSREMLLNAKAVIWQEY